MLVESEPGRVGYEGNLKQAPLFVRIIALEGMHFWLGDHPSRTFQQTN